MSRAKHTPGPWVVDLRAQESPLIRGGDDYLDDMPQAVVAEVYPEDGDDAGRATMANARLIAAAPALLEAVRLMQAAVREYRLLDVKKRFSLCVADAAACTAIAKAEGRVA